MVGGLGEGSRKLSEQRSSSMIGYLNDFYFRSQKNAVTCLTFKKSQLLVLTERGRFWVISMFSQ